MSDPCTAHIIFATQNTNPRSTHHQSANISRYTLKTNIAAIQEFTVDWLASPRCYDQSHINRQELTSERQKFTQMRRAYANRDRGDSSRSEPRLDSDSPLTTTAASHACSITDAYEEPYYSGCRTTH